MDTTDDDTQRRLVENLAYIEKINLARLEEAKAHCRVIELEYEQARYNLELYVRTQHAEHG